MHTFVRAAEVWAPTSDGLQLHWAEGLFDQARALGAADHPMELASTEKLAGRAWTAGHPVLLPQLHAPALRRGDAATPPGRCTAVAVPIFLNEQLTSVVVLLCQDRLDHGGAIELWRHDPPPTTDLLRVERCTGPLGAPASTAHNTVTRGTGLPGSAWAKHAAVWVGAIDATMGGAEDGAPDGSLPASSAAAEPAAPSSPPPPAGPATTPTAVQALAWPCAGPDCSLWVLSLLASHRQPIAKRVESWLPVGEGGAHLQRGLGWCETAGNLPTGRATLRALDELGPVTRAWEQGVAQISHCAQSAFWVAQPAALLSALAMPIVRDGRVSEVLALYF